MEGLRKSVIAGAWYPGDSKVLRADIERYLKKVPPLESDGQVVGVISPHAGYVYSGEVAAHAYKTIKGQSFDSVIVIGPSHRVYFRGISVYDRGGYETPLGIVPVDVALAEKIMDSGEHISFIPSGHAQEHSVEIQLPFLQVVLGSFEFVPIVMGDQKRQACEELTEAIVNAVMGKKVLVVGSSDLSHYHPYEQAVKMDARVVSRLEEMDVDGLFNDLESGVSEACGAGPIAVTMMVARRLGADQAKLLRYANSGDVTEDRSGVVGYAAAAFFKAESKTRRGKDNKTDVSFGLSASERLRLLKIARSAIEGSMAGKRESLPDIESLALQEKRGAFVSLHSKGGRLRGCIGCIEGRAPLAGTIREMALSAAFNDPRFPPLSREELDNLDIEISVLTPLKEVIDINEIEVGTHGIYMTQGFYSGLLLPQVATQYGWDRVTFLEETCRKAGLPPLAWKGKNVKIYIFSADIFCEER